ncbi:hypothetical protein VST7929_00233 [Vibrio stylophorae]|uniref:Membrane protein FxsA n=1 Tax=Vibrio stylophorae TaxID=659351 RepID=A0ABM8ZQ30_9VIBR|nr:FxsA family protein [Vibrio stylophorae]CAH0532404.1 hypothetical protein VST7929_00233 [Vibrio stylophorae]
MFLVILLLFVVIPMVEIGVYIEMGSLLGLWPTLGLTILTAVVGASLVRVQGMQTMLRVQQQMQRGQMPAQEIVAGTLLAVAGVLLFLPGFVTDTLGALLLIPALRMWVAKWLMTRVQMRQVNGFYQRQQSQDDHTFEGEFSHRDEQQESRSSRYLDHRDDDK